MNALALVGYALVAIGLLNQGATTNGATVLWLAGIAIAATATYRPRHPRA